MAKQSRHRFARRSNLTCTFGIFSRPLPDVLRSDESNHSLVGVYRRAVVRELTVNRLAKTGRAQHDGTIVTDRIIGAQERRSATTLLLADDVVRERLYVNGLKKYNTIWIGSVCQKVVTMLRQRVCGVLCVGVYWACPDRGKMSITPGFNRGTTTTPPTIAPTGRHKVVVVTPRC